MNTNTQHEIILTMHIADLDSPEAAGELRHAMREQGWRADLAWAEVGSRSASSAVRAADGGDVRRTIAYLPALRSLDGGALRVWTHGDVPVPQVAEVREVMLATEGVDDWISEVFEAPPERIETGGDDSERAEIPHAIV